MDEDPNGLPPRSVGAIDAAILVGLVVVLPMLLLQIAVTVVADLRGIPTSLARETVLGRPIFAAAAQLATSAILLEAARRWYARGRRFSDAFGLHAASGRTLVLAVIAGVTMQFPLAELGNWVEHLAPIPLAEKERLAAILTPGSFLEGVGLVLAVVAVAPVTEELLFRGLMLPGVARGSGVVVGVLVSSVGFGLAHVRPAAVVVACVGGLVLAFATIRTDSIVPAIVLHASSNAVPILLPSRILPIPGLNVVTDGPSHLSPLLVGVAAIACGLAVAMLAPDEPRPD